MGTRKQKLKHSHKRGRQRFGVNLSQHQLCELVLKIQRGEGKHLETQTNTRTMWRVVLPDGTTADVIYCKKHKAIVTVLPKETLTTD